MRSQRALSVERLGLLHHLYVELRNNPTAQNYLKLRSEFPECNLVLAAGGDPVRFLEKELGNEGIAVQLVEDAMLGDESDIDALCLKILECIAARDALPKSGAGYIAKRRAAIKDSTANFLITLMMDAFEWHPSTRIPTSLIFLIRHQFFGTAKPGLAELTTRRQKQHSLALHVGSQLHDHDGKPPSINELRDIAGLPRNTAARLLKENEFLRWMNVGANAATDFNRRFSDGKVSHQVSQRKVRAGQRLRKLNASSVDTPLRTELAGDGTASNHDRRGQ